MFNKTTNKSHIALLLSILLLFAGCRKEESDIFPHTPAERLQHAIDEYQSILTAATNGWQIKDSQLNKRWLYLLKFMLRLGHHSKGSKLTKNAAYEQEVLCIKLANGRC